jgi:hypothetical protein
LWHGVRELLGGGGLEAGDPIHRPPTSMRQ